MRAQNHYPIKIKKKNPKISACLDQKVKNNNPKKKKVCLSIVFPFSLFSLFLFIFPVACARACVNHNQTKIKNQKPYTKKSHLLRRQAAEANKQSANNSDSVNSSPSSSFSACRHHLCSCFSNILARYSHVILARSPPRRRARLLFPAVININGLLSFSFSPFLFRFCHVLFLVHFSVPSLSFLSSFSMLFPRAKSF